MSKCDCENCQERRTIDWDVRGPEFEKLYGETADRLRSLLTELWSGVSLHGLTAPSKEREPGEGARLIHAYCGGIAEVRNDRDEWKEKAEKFERLYREGQRKHASTDNLLKFAEGSVQRLVKERQEANDRANRTEVEVGHLSELYSQEYTHCIDHRTNITNLLNEIALWKEASACMTPQELDGDLDAGTAENEKLRRLSDYAVHRIDCATRVHRTNKCTCGLDDLRYA